MEIPCRFHSKQDLPTPVCGNYAAGFIRIHRTGRLVPLCRGCEKTFVEQSEKIRKVPQIQKVIPGDGSFSHVSLEEGLEEYLKQTPTTEEMKEAARKTYAALVQATDNHQKN
jgi:hypothetical protein